MNAISVHPKITPTHLARKAMVYLRQSSAKQVQENLESQRLQYAMADRAKELGFQQVEAIDCDLGWSASIGAAPRGGFDYLISAVARGEVGIVLAREVSRLSRTDKDFCQLLEVCQVFDTLIGDEQSVYDLASLDDQLILGIKGTLSVVELKVLRMRLIQGQEAKARRGEMHKRLPCGYVRDGNGQVVITPDARLREALQMVFRKFREVWSVRQTFLWFRDHDVPLPVNVARGQGLRWQIPTQAFIRDVLTNPYYAGAYVWGRRPMKMELVAGRLRKRQSSCVPAEKCRVFIPHHHEGYIDWDTYQENQRIIHGNNMKRGSDESASSVRRGRGLLNGLLRCGRCGRKMHVRYWGKQGTVPRYLCRGEFDMGGEYCLRFGGDVVDRRVSQEILQVISPLGVEASLRAIEELTADVQDRLTLLQRQHQQLEYEAQRAFEQYNEVDPRNRLAADELERRWNSKLQELNELRVAVSELDQEAREVTESERARVTLLGHSFDSVWNHPDCPPELKKKIARTIIEEIVTHEIDHDTLRFIIHWKGGVHTEFRMRRPKSSVGQPTSDEALDILRKMAVRYGDDQIASVLNRLGHRTGKGKRWNQRRVASARGCHGIPGQKRMKQDPDLLTLNEAARYCQVSHHTIKRLVEAGLLVVNQVTVRAPWEIRRVDLDAEPVRSILERLRKTGKLVLQGACAERSLPLFPEIPEKTGEAK
jgi:DNA invertase Pin-like site-specific DNA recombinase